jgi:hypothetical protein
MRQVICSLGRCWQFAARIYGTEENIAEAFAPSPPANHARELRGVSNLGGDGFPVLHDDRVWIWAATVAMTAS